MLEARHPLAKLASAIFAIVVVTLSESFAVLIASAAICVLLLSIRATFAPRRMVRRMIPFLIFALTSSWIYLVAENPAHAALGVPGWRSALIVAGRILAIGLVSLTFAETTAPAGLARALVQHAGLPRRFVYGALAAIQFIPALAEDYRFARLAARASLPRRTGGTMFMHRWKRLAASLSPDIVLVVVAGAMRRAGNAALSMQMRGLRGGKLHNLWRHRPFAVADGALLVLTVVFYLTVHLAGVVLSR